MPERTCVGCGQKKSQEAMFLLGLKTGQVELWSEGRRGGGRGAYVCGPPCTRKAVERRAFQRAFKTKEVKVSEGLLGEVEKAHLERSQREAGAKEGSPERPP